MIVGVLTLDVAIFEARTLKDKRRVISSLKQRIRNRFNVSVAEIDHTDRPQRSSLAVAMVSQDARGLHSQLDQVVDVVRRSGALSLLSYHRDVI